jgi:hypothetical protein
VTALPPGIGPDDLIAVTWHNDLEGMTRVVAELGGAKITIETDQDSIELVPWLVASAPKVLEAAWAEIERQEQAPEEDNPQEEP